MNARKPPWRNPFFWSAIVLCLAVFCFARNYRSRQAPQPMTTFSGPTMGTNYMVKVVDLPPAVDAAALREEINDKLDRVDGLMSTYRSDSELMRFNRFERAEWFPLSEETAAVVDEALRVGQLTGGAFDVSVGPLVNLWNFGPVENAEDRVPSDEEIEGVRSRVGPAKIQVRRSPPAVRKLERDLYIDLSGVAKGFAVDRIAEHLETRGIENYLVEVGGDLRAKGHNQRDRPWQLAVEAPIAGIRAIHRVVGLENLAMATSGDYRNFFEKDKVRYSHIIDPRSGRPIAHNLVSVTVLDPSCTRADALATGLMVLGPDAGYELAVREKLAVLFIINGETGFVEKPTPEFTKRVE